MKDGKLVTQPETDLYKLQQRAKENLSFLEESYKRLTNPHLYGVGLESGLYAQRQEIILSAAINGRD